MKFSDMFIQKMTFWGMTNIFPLYHMSGLFKNEQKWLSVWYLLEIKSDLVTKSAQALFVLKVTNAMDVNELLMKMVCVTALGQEPESPTKLNVWKMMKVIQRLAGEDRKVVVTY